MVGNGCVPEQVPAGVRTVGLAENVGIPEGRNIGAAEVKGDYLFFFDNDARLPATDTLARLVAVFPRPGAVHSAYQCAPTPFTRARALLYGRWPAASGRAEEY
ncbi:glycosyltransferase family 2 protein [Streptomyces sp. NPDC051578]|uniref:glycosyltransferase family 2 protein n=1 Tax=Streptomyces sp. NPDC051578 TaxID=3365662 RepID=UPI00379E66DF